MRINIGCGHGPIKGWRNFDNSFSVRLSKLPYIALILYKMKLLRDTTYSFIDFCRLNHIEYGDAIKKLPIGDGSADVFYSSHMLEHLDQANTAKALKEARRSLCSGGVIRIVVPDLRKLAEQYIQMRDADKFISSTLLCQPAPRTIFQKLAFIVSGSRNHQWMYDGESLCRALTAHGFINARIVSPGTTIIKSPEPLNLYERAAESVYVEAENP